eukprot:SAG22_NODE_4565_length_1232_cov_1.187996_1_plen_79_part_00
MGPPADYVGPGQYPVAADGLVEKTVCFDWGNSNQHLECLDHTVVGVIRCEDFLLWRLPDAPASHSCGSAYCTAPSGLR